MSSKPWYRWYPGDYLQDTVHLSLEQDGAYRRMLDWSWANGPIPDSLPAIARIMRVHSQKARCLMGVLRGYFEERSPLDPPPNSKKGGYLISIKLEKGRVADLDKSLKCKEAGLISVEKNRQRNDNLSRASRSRSREEEEKRREEKKSNQKKVPRQSPPTASPVVPDGLCQQSWEAYLKHRRDSLKSALKPASQTRLMRWLVDQGTAETQAAIVDQTIRNGWTGLFELKAGAKPAPAKVKAKTWPIEAYAPWGGIRPEWLEDGPEKDRALEMKALASHTAVREPTDQEAAENQAVVTNLFRR